MGVRVRAVGALLETIIMQPTAAGAARPSSEHFCRSQEVRPNGPIVDRLTASPPPFSLVLAVLDRLDAFLPSLRAANEDLECKAATDPSSVDMEHIEDPEAQHIEMVRFSLRLMFASAWHSHSHALCSLPRTQDLHCGLFEARPQETDSTNAQPLQPHVLLPGRGAPQQQEEGEEDDDEAQLPQLCIPSEQTAAVAAARRAGRTLISEVPGSDNGGDSSYSGPSKEKAADAVMAAAADAASCGGSQQGRPKPKRPRR